MQESELSRLAEDPVWTGCELTETINLDFSFWNAEDGKWFFIFEHNIVLLTTLWSVGTIWVIIVLTLTDWLQ